MSVKATAYRRVKLEDMSAGNNAFLISTYTDTVLDSVDEYIVECEAACTLTQKSSTAFQIAVAYDSPLNPPVAYLCFMRSGI